MQLHEEAEVEEALLGIYNKLLATIHLYSTYKVCHRYQLTEDPQLGRCGNFPQRVARRAAISSSISLSYLFDNQASIGQQFFLNVKC